MDWAASDLSGAIIYLEGVQAEAESRLCSLGKQRDALLERRDTYAKAEVVLNTCAEDVRENISKVLSSIASVCLKPIFGDDAELVVSFRVLPKGGIGADITVSIGGATGDALDSFGGSCSDLIEVALRAAYILLTDAPRLLVLDEPYRNLAAAYLPHAQAFLRLLRDKYGFQVIMATHRPELAEVADSIIEITQEGGKSYGSKVHNI